MHTTTAHATTATDHPRHGAAGDRDARPRAGTPGPYRALRCCRPGRTPDDDRGQGAWRARILEHLARHGPTPVRHLPAGWPLTRPLVGALLRQMADEGLVEMEGALAHRGWRTARLTARGRRTLFAA